MAGKGQQIHIQVFYVNGNIAEGLYCICMEDDALGLDDLSYFFNGFNGADLVVGKHD